jgi:non-ribosomal peptide synthetase component F
MVLLSAFAVLLAAESGDDDVLVVSPIAGRLRSEWEALCGFFVNRVVVRARVDAGLTFRELLQRVRESSAGAFAHQTVPFELLLAELGLPPSAVPACFVVQNAPVREGGGGPLPGLEVDLVDDDSGRDFAPLLEVYSPVGARYALSLVLRHFPDGFRGGLEYDAALVDPARAARLADAFAAVVARAGDDANAPVRELLDLAR